MPEDFGWIHAYDVQQLSLHVGGEQAARATVSPALPEALVEILGAVAGVDRVDLTPQARFTDDLGIDSLTMVDSL